jgi:hypothetical protein
MDRKDYDNTGFARFEGIFSCRGGVVSRFAVRSFRVLSRHPAHGLTKKMPENPRTHLVGDTSGAVIRRNQKGALE